MALRWVIGEIRTGRELRDLPVKSESSWSRMLNGPDEITVVLPARDPDVISLDLLNLCTPGKMFIAVVWDNVVLASGVLWTAKYNIGNGEFVLTASGLITYFSKRVVMPSSAVYASTIDAALDSTWSNLSYGTIMKRLVQQSETWVGGNLPIVYQDDIVDDKTRTYRALDTGKVAERIYQLSEVRNGPDFDFKGRLQEDGMGVEWLLRTGTPTDPTLHSSSVHIFAASVPESPVSDLEVSWSGKELAGQAWSTGTSEATIVSRSSTSDLIDLGYPLLEDVDSTHSDLTVFETLSDYSDALVYFGRSPIETWTFTTRADTAPLVTEYDIGDWLIMRIKGDPILPDKDNSMRIVGISGDARGKRISLTCQPSSGAANGS